MSLSRRQVMAVGALPLVRGFTANSPARPLRKDCFFGVHFDLHPNGNDTVLGRDLTPEMAKGLLDRVRPDFVQYDCKGHPGYLGYPSRIGVSAPGIVKDSLEIWRGATAMKGVSLYIHFSGVWDGVAAGRHPEWARVKPDGKPDDRITSTFGPYVDQLMIPELEEVIRKYDLDGAWIDGECWAVAPDYCARAQAAFQERTGIRELPQKAGDAGWLEFLELNRDQFREYVRHYVEAIHRNHPKFQIASNWLYSSYVPERPEIPVDYLSGDFLGTTPVSSARLEARYLASAGKPWDLMAWGFSVDRASGAHVLKRPVQLKQESAAVISQGGGFQIYYNPTRAGWIDERLVDVMAEVGDFCRARREVSFHTEAVPQVAVLFSGYSLYRTSNKLFGGWGAGVDPARGSVEALLAGGYSVELLPDWKLNEAARYPVIVVPDWPDIGEEARRALAAYAAGGGALVVLGAANGSHFGARGEEQANAAILGDSGFAPVYGTWGTVEDGVVESRYPSYDARGRGVGAAGLKGKVAVAPGPIGSVYARTHAPPIHEFLRRVVSRVFEPVVRVSGLPGIEVSVRRKSGRLLVHLTNTTAMQVGPEYPVVDFVPVIGPVKVDVRLARRPARVVLEPSGRRVAAEWRGGVLSATLPGLEVHSVLAIDGGGS